MRKILLATALIAAALVPATASAGTLRAHRVSPTAMPVGRFDAKTLAYKPSAYGTETQILLRGDDGATRTVVAPAGCDLTGAGGGLLAGVCGQRQVGSGSAALDLIVARPDGTEVARVTSTVTADYANVWPTLSPAGAGSRWLEIPNEGKESLWTTLVDWHTGAARDVGLGVPIDLDAADPVKALCAPLKPGHGEVTVSGRWVLQGDDDYSETPTLRRCGSSKAVRLQKGFRPRALGNGWVAGQAPLTDVPRVELIRLSDRHRFIVAGAPEDALDALAGEMLFTRGRLYAYDIDQGLYTVKLPAR